MLVSTDEFKKNIDKYLNLAQTDDILITRHGTPVAKLSKPQPADRQALLDQLVGVASDIDIDEDGIREGKLARQ
mgnify:CR=1 FL=1